MSKMDEKIDKIYIFGEDYDMEKNSKNIFKSWKLWAILIIILIVLMIGIIMNTYLKNNKTQENINIQLGDIVSLTKEQEKLLRDKTITDMQRYLKAPSTAQFQDSFNYSYDEPNIIKVEGYVDSQNDFGAMLRGNFLCEYFAIENDIETLVYVKYNEKELFNIKNTYIEEYERQTELQETLKFGNELNQEKLNYIMNEFNEDETNDTARVTNVTFNKNESNINIEITAKTNGFNTVSENYWIDFSICSIMDYIKEYEIVGIVKIKLFDKGKNVEVTFDNNFLKNKWRENQQINLVKELFGENYKMTN